jgi:2'-5' RNA ligase
MAAEPIRCFIAVQLPADLRAALARLEQGERSSGDGWKWVKPDLLHITLRFLGEISPKEVENARVALREAAAQLAAFEFSVEGLGVFPSPQRARVLWAGVDAGREKLVDLAERISQALSARGFPPEDRPFTPHLTLARARERLPAATVARLGALLQRPVEPIGHCPVGQVDLMQSVLGPKGPTYTSLDAVPLAPPLL